MSSPSLDRSTLGCRIFSILNMRLGGHPVDETMCRYIGAIFLFIYRNHPCAFSRQLLGKHLKWGHAVMAHSIAIPAGKPCFGEWSTEDVSGASGFSARQQSSTVTVGDLFATFCLLCVEDEQL